MTEYLVIDGYNILNNWPELVKIKKESGIEHARDRLISIISNYGAFKKIKSILVFDAHLVKGSAGSKNVTGDVEVIFTREGISADMVIEKLIGSLPSDSVIRVATSDWVEQRIVLGKGALRISARELRLQILQEKKVMESFLRTTKFDTQPLDSNLSKTVRDVLEKLRRNN